MTREEFFKQLTGKLLQMPKKDSDEAINYYNEYVDEAMESGKEWAEIEASLGTPQDVASKIKADYSVNRVKEKPTLTNAMKALVAVLGVFALPIAAPIAFALLAVVIALVIAAFGIILGLFGAVFGTLIGLGVAIGGAISLIPATPAVGIGLLGMLLIAAGIIILICYLVIRLTGYIISLIARLIKKLIDSSKRGNK